MLKFSCKNIAIFVLSGFFLCGCGVTDKNEVHQLYNYQKKVDYSTVVLDCQGSETNKETGEEKEFTVFYVIDGDSGNYDAESFEDDKGFLEQNAMIGGKHYFYYIDKKVFETSIDSPETGYGRGWTGIISTNFSTIDGYIQRNRVTSWKDGFDFEITLSEKGTQWMYSWLSSEELFPCFKSMPTGAQAIIEIKTDYNYNVKEVQIDVLSDSKDVTLKMKVSEVGNQIDVRDYVPVNEYVSLRELQKSEEEEGAGDDRFKRLSDEELAELARQEAEAKAAEEAARQAEIQAAGGYWDDVNQVWVDLSWQQWQQPAEEQQWQPEG